MGTYILEGGTFDWICLAQGKDLSALLCQRRCISRRAPYSAEFVLVRRTVMILCDKLCCVLSVCLSVCRVLEGSTFKAPWTCDLVATVFAMVQGAA